MSEFIACPRIQSDASVCDYIKVDAITLVGYPRPTNDGHTWTCVIGVSGNTVSPLFDTKEKCEEFYTNVKNKLGIS